MLRALILACLCLPLRVLAQQQTEVDVELFLAVDVSRSMTPAELEIQRRGYAEALSSSAVTDAITGGMTGRIAVTYVEWAGAQSQTVVVPWTLLETAKDAHAVANDLTAFFSDGMRRTSISGALLYASESFETNRFLGLRRVIDISGDGPNNQGRAVLAARDAVLARGIIINGLPLMTHDAFNDRWGIEDLDIYYENCVIGGPGSFALPVRAWDQFAQAVKRKLVLEIAGAPAPPQDLLRRVDGYDCLIGEKIWQSFERDWMMP